MRSVVCSKVMARYLVVEIEEKVAAGDELLFFFLEHLKILFFGTRVSVFGWSLSCTGEIDCLGKGGLVKSAARFETLLFPIE